MGRGGRVRRRHVRKPVILQNIINKQYQVFQK